jgi:hypothetical protein
MGLQDCGLIFSRYPVINLAEKGLFGNTQVYPQAPKFAFPRDWDLGARTQLEYT